MMRIERDTQKLTAEQQLAVDFLLASAPGCGLHRLRVEELIALCERIGAALDCAERAGYDNGYTTALADCRDYQGAVIASRNLKRAHS